MQLPNLLKNNPLFARKIYVAIESAIITASIFIIITPMIPLFTFICSLASVAMLYMLLTKPQTTNSELNIKAADPLNPQPQVKTDFKATHKGCPECGNLTKHKVSCSKYKKSEVNQT